ncbi:MAG: SPOR domain-containing protein [Bacteroidales bacterium]|nr:SPOR domain-containing protein [Bacteroides sp.]MCM1197318.1 SPOR domain-containing protein [Clostridium sp.]MCM1503063.1 SPOR domain-containing protein [Bacteroidales bacterium]
MVRKRLFLSAVVSVLGLLAGRTVSAQEPEIPEGYELVDSLVYVPSASVDTSLAGKNIFKELPLVLKGDAADVRVHQSQGIALAMDEHFRTNGSRTVSGYRVRIFFDNRQTARAASEATLNSFIERHRDIAAYRSYVNPYFKVTAGDFRTKSEAMQLLDRIKGEFPSAFIVKENINYPVVDKERPVIVDTVKVLRPLPETIL